MNASEIKGLAEALGNFLWRKGTGRQWALRRHDGPGPTPLSPDPHGWHGGLENDQEVLEAADETRLTVLGLASAPRLRRNDTFIVSYHPVLESVEEPAGLEWPLPSAPKRSAAVRSRYRFGLERVLACDRRKSLEGSRALLEYGEFVGRTVELTSSLSPLYWQPNGISVRRTILRHVGTWIEVDGPDDLVLPAYRCAMFSAKE